jgi:cytochrome c-type biogenesis protein CcmH
VVLDDTQGMSPEMTLSRVPEVIVVARVSKSGMATAQNGDLEGMSAPLKAGTRAVTISIANVLSGQKAPPAAHIR